MADAPLTSDDRQDQLLRQEEEAAEGNGNGNNGDSRSRTRFDYDASAGDDDGCSFGSGGTGSDAADEDGGFTAGADLDVGRMTLAGGDHQPPTTVTTETSAALAAMTLTDTATAAGSKAKIEPDTEPDAEAGDDEDDVEAPPAVIAEAGTAASAIGSKVVLRQGKHKLAMPVEILAGISKFLPFGEGAAGGTMSIAGVILDCLDSDDEKKAFWKAFMIGNFSALKTAYVLCQSRRKRKLGMDLLDKWEKRNEELVAEYFEVPIAEALRSIIITSAGSERISPVRIFRSPDHAISMDHPTFLLRSIRQGSLDVCGDDPFLRGEDGSVTHDFGICSLINVAMTIESPNCLSALLDLAKADRPTLTYPDGRTFLHIANGIFYSKSTPMGSFELQLLDYVLHHEVCDVNVLSNEGCTALHIVLYELWNLGPDDSQNRFSRCLATIAMLVKAGADIDREGGVNPITPQEIAIEMTESDDEAVVARGVLALEVLNGRLLVNEDIPGLIAKSYAFAGILSFI